MSQSDALDHLNTLSGGFASVLKIPLMLLPGEQRDGILSIYAFGKVIDDIADGPLPASEKQHRLHTWQAYIQAEEDVEAPTFFSDDDMATWQVTQQTLTTFDLSIADFSLFIDAMHHDALADPYAFETRDQVVAYLDGAGASLVRMILPIIGAGDHDALAYAEALARAIKATNLLRDFVADGEEGVIYAAAAEIEEPPTLTRTWLKGQATYPERQFLKSLAQENLSQAKDLWPAAQRTKLMPAYMLQKVYEGLLVTL